MFELKDLPSYETLVRLGEEYKNPDVDGLHHWLVWASATSEMLSAFEANLAQTCGLSQTVSVKLVVRYFKRLVSSFPALRSSLFPG